MAMEEHEFRSLLANATDARWIRCNLHVHTPATPWDWDACPGQTTPAFSVSPPIFFQALAQTSLELAAITDHNTVQWCAPLMQLARQARPSGISRLHILPGVEITSYEGPHITAVFDESLDPALIKDMLVRLGLFADGRSDDGAGRNSPKPPTLQEILTEICRLHGLPIAPHVHNKDGLWGNKEFRGRTEILNDPRLRILAAPSGDIKRIQAPDGSVRLLYKNMDTAQVTNSFAFIDVADCHRIEDFELHSTWIKMARPSLEGVRQIIYEPELRVAHTLQRTEKPVEYPVALHFAEPTAPQHPHIIGLAVTGGMLDGLLLSFSPHQNSIIGKNYSGKSAILDCIRFGLNALPIEEDLRAPFVNRLRGILGDGAHVRVYVLGADLETYCAARTLSTTQTRGGSSPRWEVEGQPDVYSYIEGRFMPQSDLSIRDVFSIEVYPQGELVKIKDNIPRQMNIVDALASVDELLRQLAPGDDESVTVLDRLRANSDEICNTSERKDELFAEVGALPQLQTELGELERLVSTGQFAELQRWRDIEASAGRISRDLQRTSREWKSTEVPALSEPMSTTNLDAPGMHDAMSEQLAASVTQVFSTVARRLARIRDLALASLARAVDDLGKLAASADQHATSLAEQLANSAPSGKAEIAASVVERISQKKARIAQLGSKRQEAEGLVARISALEADRQRLLAEYDATCLRIREARKTVVEAIDRGSAEDVSAQLREGADNREYRRLLDDIASNLTSAANRIANKQAQLDLVARSVPPRILAEIIQAGDVVSIQEMASGVTENTARILVGSSKCDIHRLQACHLGDEFSISFRKQGETDFTPIDGGLSGGEQALALISVAMVPKDLPLLVDQPEDELGPALITGNLVEQIRRVKPTRQLLFVTHVANIPVLGDSEQIVYMQQVQSPEGKSLTPRARGPLDDSEVVACVMELDGGPAAFAKRSERYSAALPNHAP